MAKAIATPVPTSPTPRRARAENFPVASRLLAPSMRPKVMALYCFARAADDIADDPALAAAIKLRRLAEFRHGLAPAGGGAPPAVALRRAVREDGALLAHAARLLDAFESDAESRPCRDWDGLMAYCASSAAPVGRFLLHLHGEDPALLALADSLCAALQILNHLQDCRADFTRLGRLYLPADWMEREGACPADLARRRSAPALRRVFDAMLEGVDGLLRDAAPLAAALADRRLAMETAAIAAVARRLSERLRRDDPLARPVTLSPLSYAGALGEGLLAGWRRQA